MDIDIKELIKAATENLNLKDFKGDVVGVKVVENQIGNIEPGGIGIQNVYSSAKKKAAAIGIQPSSTVTAGLICSIIGVILSVLITLFSILLLIVAINTDESYSYSYNSTAFFSSVQSITDLCGLIF